MAGACVTATAFSAKMRDYKIGLIIDPIWGTEKSKDAMKTLFGSFSAIIKTIDLEN